MNILQTMYGWAGIFLFALGVVCLVGAAVGWGIRSRRRKFNVSRGKKQGLTSMRSIFSELIAGVGSIVMGISLLLSNALGIGFTVGILGITFAFALRAFPESSPKRSAGSG